MITRHDVATVCPVCMTQYWGIRRPGQVCADLSQDQQRNCVGRVIRAEAFAQAEWRRPYSWDQWRTWHLAAVQRRRTA